jgi:hydrogenase/urease accessory protein HupE
MALAAPAAAHDDGVSSSRVEVHEREVRWQLDVGLAPLARALGLTPADLQAALTPGPARTRIAGYLTAAVGVTVADRPLPAQAGALSLHPDAPAPGRPAPAGAPLSRVVQDIVFTSPAPIQALDLRVAPLAELGERHRALVSVRWGPAERQFVRVGPGVIQLDPGAMTPSRWAVAGEFLPWGIHHILLGYDHLAFLLALLVAATHLRQMIAVVTAFTLAHSVTLVLSATLFSSLPPRVPEVLIAASVAYVAAQNLGWWRGRERNRWLVAFVFGLIHGLGFASELRQRLADTAGGLWIPVLSFNLGVELGQVAIVALVFPLLDRLRRGRTPAESAARQRRLVRMTSVPLVILGLAWTFARLLG